MDSLGYVNIGLALFIIMFFHPAYQASWGVSAAAELNDRTLKLPSSDRAKPGTLSNTMQQEPRNAEELYRRAIHHKQQQQPAKAINALQQVLELQPQHAEAHYMLGIIYGELNQYRAAVTEFEAALALQPNFREAHYSLGVCYEFYQPDIENALAHYRDFLELGGKDERVKQLVKYSTERPGNSPESQIPDRRRAAYQPTETLEVTATPEIRKFHHLSTNELAMVVPPRFTYQPKPAYPLNARRKGWHGTVTLDVELLADGTIGDITVTQSSGYHELDAAAQKAVKMWRHIPAKHGSVAVTRHVSLPIPFQLDPADLAQQKTLSIGTTYKTLDGQQAITIAGVDKMVLDMADSIFVGKYSVQGDTLLAVITIEGKSQELSYTIGPDGLVGKDGTKLISPEQNPPSEHFTKFEKPQLIPMPTFDAPGVYQPGGPEPSGEGHEVEGGGKYRSIDAYGLKHFSYLVGVKRKIETMFSVPFFMQNQGPVGTPIVGFTIRRNGILAEAVLLRSSGYAVLDKALLDAVRRAAPYSPFPNHLADSEISIRVYATVS